MSRGGSWVVLLVSDKISEPSWLFSFHQAQVDDKSNRPERGGESRVANDHQAHLPCISPSLIHTLFLCIMSFAPLYHTLTYPLITFSSPLEHPCYLLPNFPLPFPPFSPPTQTSHPKQEPISSSESSPPSIENSSNHLLR